MTFLKHLKLNRPLAVLLIGIVLAAGCAGTAPKQNATRESAANKKRAMDLFIEGKVAEAKEKYAEAITSYLEALQFDPQSADIALSAARAFMKDRKARSALHYATMAVRLNPDKPESWRMLQQLEQLTGRTAEAAEALKMYMKLSPESSFMDIIWLARYYFELEKDDQARNLLVEALKDEKRSSEEMSSVADLLSREGYVDDAVSIFRRIVERDPMDIEAWRELGLVFEENRKLNEARAAYLSGLENNPGSFELLLMVGNLCLYENDWDCAISYFEKADAAGANIPKIQNVLCSLYFYAGREQDAAAAVKKIRTAGEDDASFYFSLGKAMNFLERFKEAVGYFSTGFEKGIGDMTEEEVFNAYTRYAHALVRLDRHDDAIELIHGSATEHVKNRDGIKLLEASIYMDMKRYDDAILIYEWLLGSDPENVRYIMMLGQVYNSAKRYDKAEETFLRINKVDPDNIDYLIQLSLVYDFTGQFKKAEKSLLQVLKKEPKNALALNNLAYMYIEHDVKISKAITMAKKALDIDPRNGAYHDTLGWAYYKKGKYGEAMEYIENALKWEDTPDRGIVYDHYGDILLKLGRKQEAADAYRQAIELGEDAGRIQPKLDSLK